MTNVEIHQAASVGLSDRALNNIPGLIQRYIDRGLIPGAVTFVARRGKVVHLDAFGYKNIATAEPMANDTLFRIASMTKPMTSLALLLLMEEGKVRLSDPIANYLPVFSNMKVRVSDGKGGTTLVPAKRKINVRHLLTHTAGFQAEYLPGENKEYLEIAQPLNRSGTMDDFVTRLAQVPLKTEPGTEWDYSRATCVVGRLVEVVSGQTLKEFFEQRFFEPLGMKETYFFVPPKEAKRFAVSYKPGPDMKLVLDDPDNAESFFMSQDSQFYIGSGGLVSTASDYFKFADMLRQGGVFGKERICGRTTIELMVQNHIGNKRVWVTGAGNGFGLGVGVMLDQGVSHSIVSNGSYGWSGIYCTHWWNDPVEQLTGMVLTQVRPWVHLDLLTDFQNVVTAAIQE